VANLSLTILEELICIGFKLLREEHDSYREYEFDYSLPSTIFPFRCNHYSNVAKVEWKEI
jgi:hypothetical protein